jgi:hypothetical protein
VEGGMKELLYFRPPLPIKYGKCPQFSPSFP